MMRIAEGESMYVTDLPNVVADFRKLFIKKSAKLKLSRNKWK